MVIKKKTRDVLELIMYKPDLKLAHKIPLLEGTVRAGFPSSAENFVEKTLDLNELLIRHPSATFFIRVKGSSMERAGIKNNDILIVDRALRPSDNKIVIARIDNDLTVKRIRRVGDHLFLVPDCSEQQEEIKPIKITDDMDFEIWGIVTHVIHTV